MSDFDEWVPADGQADVVESKPDPDKPPLVGRDWCYRLACTDGPVFRGAELLW